MIGRDHLDSGSVASPYRETEAMADGSDAIADWPLLNALVNTAAGASWVSDPSWRRRRDRPLDPRRHGRASRTARELAAQKLERVLTTDPGMGVIRHADAGYERAVAGGTGARRAAPDEATAVAVAVRADRRCRASGLRTRARERTCHDESLARDPGLIDDLIETMRAAGGAGLAANQIGAHRAAIAVIEVDGNPRYPYKPPIPLTVIVNPVLEPLDDETVTINEGCLSVPGLRGEVERHVNIRVRYLDRDGDAAR